MAKFGWTAAALLGLTSIGGPIGNATAENCWMIGCSGRVGYLFLPTTHPPTTQYVVNRHDCGDPNVSRPLGDSIPDVNSVVPVMEDEAQLLSEADIESHLGSFQAPVIEHANDAGECHAVWRRPAVAGDVLKKGSKVKILGYRTFVSSVSEESGNWIATNHEQLVFALVMVKTDFPD